jgi:hypothetical protein
MIRLPEIPYGQHSFNYWNMLYHPDNHSFPPREEYSRWLWDTHKCRLNASGYLHFENEQDKFLFQAAFKRDLVGYFFD